MNLYSIAKKFPTGDLALLHLIKTRWPNGVRCVACDRDKTWLIEATGKTGKPRKLFQCADCGYQFSATANTLFHDSHLPLTKWFAVIALMVEGKKGISANQVKRHIPMSYKTAWYVCHRIREAMQEPQSSRLGGESVTVEIDETYVGGRKRGVGVKAGRDAKTIVVGMAERGGRIQLKTVKSRTSKDMKPVIDSTLRPTTKEVVTDALQTYRDVIPQDKHKRVNHKEELKDKNWTSTQTVENALRFPIFRRSGSAPRSQPIATSEVFGPCERTRASRSLPPITFGVRAFSCHRSAASFPIAFSLFKRGIVGNYHQLSAEHLDRYLGEFCWRYNRRRMQPWLFDMSLTNLVNKKPLPYKDLTF